MQLVYAALLLAVTQAWAAPTEPPTSDVRAAGPSTALGPSASVEPHTDLLDVAITKKKKKGKKHEPYRYNNKVLLFRHGEKRSDSSIGLSVKGKKRAQCLRKKLGKQSRHNIGLILAEGFNPDTGKRRRPYDTVKHLARDLGLKVDVSCEVDDFDCVRERVEEYARSGGKGDIAVCWKHSYLHKIARELGAKKTAPYPDDRFDIIWTLTRRRIVRKESEQCPGLDPVVRHDPDLEIKEEADCESELAFSLEEDEPNEDEEALMEGYLGQADEQISFGGVQDELD
ncbi:hypothetical protein JCM8202_002488 [Rhodotorula sphaerocarpa]